MITVIGYSFNFDYRYDSDGGFTRNDGLYVPVGEPITLHMVTPLFTPGTKNLEVIHSFWVPEWGVKQDATPGRRAARRSARRTSSRRASATYEVQCTELCGSGHGEMHFKNIHVLSQGGLRQVARRRQGGGGQGQAAGQRQPGPGGLQRRGLRRLPHVHARQGERQDRAVAG